MVLIATPYIYIKKIVLSPDPITSMLNHSTSQVVVIACLNSLNYSEHRLLLSLVVTLSS